MKLRITLFALVIILTLTAVQYGLAAAPAQENRATNLAGVIAIAATTTPTPETSAGDSATEHEHDASAAEDTTGQTVVVSEQEQKFQVTIATYLMDTAGFHAMDERINQEGTIDAGDAGVVNRVIGVLEATAWPADLQTQVDELKDTLSQYAEALANDDVEAAKPLATQAHELQHDLSHAAGSWLTGGSGGAEHGAEGEHDHAAEQDAGQGG
ncbi:MAG: hypothetical protein HS114_00050 [Anaerolineales bacterium]|nr:hypothetical protein [Anaerolineales bacterium]